MTPAYTTRMGIAVGLTSLAVIQTEVLLTRLLSVVVWYHFAFVAISVALFGLGVAAVAVHFLEHRLPPERTPELAAWGAVLTALSIVLVDVTLLGVTPDWFGAGEAGVFTKPTAKLLILFVIAALPFIAAGFTIALSLWRWAERVHQVYFWDLVGAGVGGASVVPLLDNVGAPVALLVPAAIAGVAALVFAGWSGRIGRRAFVAAAIALPILLGATNDRTRLFEVRVAKGIALDALRPELNRWNSFSMVTVLSQSAFRGWAPSTRWVGSVPEQKTLVIDMNAMTPLTRFSGSLSEVAHLSFDLSAFVHRVKPNPESVCVLGAGGGRDVLSALAAGADHVTAVEINPLIVNDVMLGEYREFTGGLYARKDVTVAVEDGRSFVARSDRSFDVVHLSMVDTSAATAAGAYALTENSLYTTDAFAELIGHLRPGGVLSVGSVSLPELAVGARLTAIARAALVRTGRNPTRAIAVVAAPWLGATGAVMYDVLVAPDGFDEQTVARITGEARELGFVVIHAPGVPPSGLPGEPAQIAAIASARDPQSLRAALAGPLDVSPTTDDRPFFFYQNRLSDLGRALTSTVPAHLFGNGMAILAKLLAVALALAAILVLAPLLLGGRRTLSGGGSVGIDAVYVACLGLGFMFIEVALLQRTSIHLGHPTATLTVVLLVILVSGGVGSLRLARTPSRRSFSIAIGAVIALAVVLALVLDPMLSATRGLGSLGRTLIAGVAIAPVGFVMGAPLPLGLGAVAGRAERRIPWLWAVNGAMSVLGSILATLSGLHFGIRATLLAGAGFYVVALLLSRKIVDSRAWPTAPSSSGGGPTSTAPSTP